MATSSLRRWLRRLPHPARLRVDGRDVAVDSGPNCWATTEESVRALNPARVEAIDSNGVMLRALSIGDRDDEGPDTTPAPQSDIVSLAKLIAEAHDAGARRHAEAYGLAFSENTKLVQILAARLSGLETAWQKAMQQTAQAQADAVLAAAQQSEGDPAGNAIAAMLATQLVPGFVNGAKAPAKKG